jgi:rare lipoprotein A
MMRRTILSVSFCVLALGAQEDHRKPSPFPEKEQTYRSSAAASRTRLPASVPDAGTRPAVQESGDAARDAAPSSDRGEACFFSKRSDGGRTASGERLNSQEMVAAHATFPLRSRVKVTNVANSKSIEVRIVDRMPASGRIISVSEAAAKELGFLSAGTAEVKLEPLP